MRRLTTRFRIIRTGVPRPILARVVSTGPNSGRIIRITAAVA